MDVSVIVPARDAAATLPRTLRAMAAQELDGAYEVIVVDDASRDATAELSRAAGVRVVSLAPGRGSARARNAGVAAAAGRVLAFTDADCAPTPGWLAGGMRALAAGADLVQGAVSPTPGVAIGPFDRTVRVEGMSGLFETASLFVRAETFAAAGGFRGFLAEERTGEDPPGLRPTLAEGHFGEDLWFAYRARRGGARLAFSAEALVHHEVFARGWRGYVRERRRLRYFPALTRVAPELREFYWARWFLSRRSAAFELGAAGALGALATRRAGPLALTLPYLALSVRAARPWGLRTGLATALGHGAGDAVGAAYLWRGSLAARTPVL